MTHPESITTHEDLHLLTPEILHAIEDVLQRNDKKTFRALTKPLQTADLADLIEAINPEQRDKLIRWLGRRFDGRLLSELDEDVREQVLDLVDNEQIAAALQTLASDDKAYVLSELEDEDREEVLENLSPEDREVVEESLSYPERSAGRLMRHETVTIPADWDVGQTIDFMRDETNSLPEVFYVVFAVDPHGVVIGKLRVSKILRRRRDVKVTEIMEREFRRLPVDLDQEDVAHIFRKYGIVEAPVVDHKGHLLGVITVDDVMDVIDEEAEEDIMRMGGVSFDDMYQAVSGTILSRIPWLAINLLTAYVAASVVNQFAEVIDKVVALAVLMPIVAGMAGNAGTQSMTVAVRALAMRELNSLNFPRVLGKEILVGFLNGLLFALLIGTSVYLWFEDVRISMAIAAAAVISLSTATFAGTVIPYFISRCKIDPAVASGIFMTTVTDIVGFLSFLGLATLIFL